MDIDSMELPETSASETTAVADPFEDIDEDVLSNTVCHC